MSVYFPKTAMPAPRVGTQVKKRRFEMPQRDASETVMPYICGIRSDSPVKTIHIGGINFEQCIYPVEKSLAKNQGRTFAAGFPVFALTKKQADAILEYASEKVVHIGKVFNWESRGWDDKGDIIAADVMILEPQETFNFADHAEYKGKPAVAPEKMTLTDDDILETATKARKKK